MLRAATERGNCARVGHPHQEKRNGQPPPPPPPLPTVPPC